MPQNGPDQTETLASDEAPAPAPRRMAAPVQSRPLADSSFSGAELIAVALTVIWLVGVLLFLLVLSPGSWAALFEPGNGLSAAMLVLGVAVPVALIWIAATTAHRLRVLREEAAALKASMAALRYANSIAVKPAARPADLPGEIVFRPARRDAGATPPLPLPPLPLPPLPLPEEQPALALGPPPAAPPALPAALFIRALNFPDGKDDNAGFQALRAALTDPMLAKLIRAAQDVLTLLSQNGIYMDDLVPDRVRPEFWHRFAAGERGRAIGPLGGIRDRDTLSAVATRMRADTIFRDAAHHFLRQFDRVFSSFEKTAADADIASLSVTRTARAFMLLGRVAGTFD